MEDKELFVVIFSGIWGLIGVIFSIIGIAMLNHRKKKEERCTSKVWGKVKDIVRQKSHDSDGGYSYSWHPVFEYTIGGLTYIKESMSGSTQTKFAIGQDIEIYYNPEDPHDYYVPEDKIPKVLGKVFTAVGMIAIVIAIIVAVFVLIYA